MKTCKGPCGETKTLDQFHLKRNKPQAQCKVCRAAYMAKHYLANLEREKAKRKAWYEDNKSDISIKGKAERANDPEGTRLKNFKRNLTKYGITKEQYDAKLAEQNNVCQICKMPFIGTPHIDHCHDTDKFRGILHHECNTAFGLLKESVARFEGCIAYAKKYKK